MSSTRTHKWDLWALVGLTLALNLPLLLGCGPLAGGALWASLVRTFVHVSPYHLLLDAGAFFMLYATLRERGAWSRLLLFGGSAVGSLLAAVAASPEFAARGLCGLSGAAHGIMAVSALEMLSVSDRLNRRVGWSLLGLVMAKSAWEAVTGQVLFGGLHFGSVGSPLPVCHAGGVVGGLLVWWFLGWARPDSCAQR